MQSTSIFLDITNVADLRLKELRGSITYVFMLFGYSLGKV